MRYCRDQRGLRGLILGIAFGLAATGAQADGPVAGNVIFFHPDGSGVNHWGALRLREVGPDGTLNWDRLPAMAVYTGHMRDALTSTSHGGATTHAYGVKVPADSFGMAGTDPLTARSGKPMSVMQEAQAAGKAVGIVQTGHIAEPGTAAFLASVPARRQRNAIAAQVLESGAEVILGGGERYLLPEGATGRFGEGLRTDGRHLIDEAKANGYTVVYTRSELAALDADTQRVLGVFASDATFNANSEAVNRAQDLPLYREAAPSVAEMADAALRLLSAQEAGFFLVVEEEGSDNFANANNAAGTLEALRRADATIGHLQDFVQGNPDTLLIMTADSDAGGMQVIGPPQDFPLIQPDKPLPPEARNGAPLDGVDGTGTPPFVSAPDKRGRRFPFAIAWSSRADVSGGILVRGNGLNSGYIHGLMDNTDIYRLIYGTLFGTWPAGNAP